LCHTPIDEQFDSGNITAVIRREERDGFRDFVRTSHPPHRHGGYNARLELLYLFVTLCQAIEGRCVDRTRTYGVDADLAVFQIYRPGDTKVGAIDYVIKLVGGAVTFGLIAIALRRRFERKYTR
jgi:hypothetical protein